MKNNAKTNTQQELMKKFLEEKKKTNQENTSKKLRPDKSTKQSTSKAKHSHNGGGFFDK